jgi:hypothetical protein
MKRLNPKTGKPFKFGDVREDGKYFMTYDSSKCMDGDYFYEWWSSKETYEKEVIRGRTSSKNHKKTPRGHFAKFKDRCKARALEKGIPFDLDTDYLQSIATDKCPIFGTDFVWGLHRGTKVNDATASLDRIIPELGYVKGNVVFISHMANRIKNDVTENELYAVADWLHDKRKEVLNAFKAQSTSVPTQHTGTSKDNSQFGTVHGAGVGQDCDGAHHHRGEPEGQDSCDSAEEGCRICMGTGVRKMATLETFYSSQDNGNTLCTAEEFAKRIRCICYQP